MKLYNPKQIQVGFIVLCPDCNIGHVKTTLSSIKNNYPESKHICVFSEKCHDNDLKEAGCKAYKGGTTLTSIINEGLSNAPCSEWNFIILAGSWVKRMLDRKFSYFLEGEKDILFPLVDKKMNFVDGTINGILIHKKAFKEIGPMMTDTPLDTCKLFWATEAQEKGYKFKAVLGAGVQ